MSDEKLSPQMLEWAANTIISLAEKEPDLTLPAIAARFRTYVVSWRKHNKEADDAIGVNARKICRLDELAKGVSSTILEEVFAETRRAYLQHHDKLETTLAAGRTRQAFYQVLVDAAEGEIRDDS